MARRRMCFIKVVLDYRVLASGDYWKHFGKASIYAAAARVLMCAERGRRQAFQSASLSRTAAASAHATTALFSSRVAAAASSSLFCQLPSCHVAGCSRSAPACNFLIGDPERGIKRGRIACLSLFLPCTTCFAAGARKIHFFYPRKNNL